MKLVRIPSRSNYNVGPFGPNTPSTFFSNVVWNLKNGEGRSKLSSELCEVSIAKILVNNLDSGEKHDGLLWCFDFLRLFPFPDFLFF